MLLTDHAKTTQHCKGQGHKGLYKWNLHDVLDILRCRSACDLLFVLLAYCYWLILRNIKTAQIRVTKDFVDSGCCSATVRLLSCSTSISDLHSTPSIQLTTERNVM